jgi:signal transduction histidine kinase
VIKDYGDIPEVYCYPQQLSQVFANMFVNAAHAITNRGEIRIRTRHSDEFIEITIEDTGEGIPPENISRIFDPFFTTKEVGKGTGLGMNVAYQIVRKHNGTIHVESTVGKGTCFTVRIPVVAGELDA